MCSQPRSEASKLAHARFDAALRAVAAVGESVLALDEAPTILPGVGLGAPLRPAPLLADWAELRRQARSESGRDWSKMLIQVVR
eukprot:SAG11_NODE_27_length_23309_cov_10.579362_21_plen_84_part_00